MGKTQILVSVGILRRVHLKNDWGCSWVHSLLKIQQPVFTPEIFFVKIFSTLWLTLQYYTLNTSLLPCPSLRSQMHLSWNMVSASRKQKGGISNPCLRHPVFIKKYLWLPANCTYMQWRLRCNVLQGCSLYKKRFRMYLKFRISKIEPKL